MPTYLLHGFRWNRILIRIFTIQNNIDECAPDWLMGPTTSHAMKASLQSRYPDITSALLPNRLRFVEQHDPTDERDTGQPYAYVADAVHEVHLGVDIDEIREKLAPDAARWDSIVRLRDEVAPGEKVGWFVVVCGDVDRTPPMVAPRTVHSLDLDAEECLVGGVKGMAFANAHRNQPPPTPKSLVSPKRSGDSDSQGTSLTMVNSGSEEGSMRPKSRASAKGFKSFILRKSKSARDLKRPSTSHSVVSPVTASPPPVPRIRV